MTKNGNLFFPVIVIVFSTMLCNVYPVALDRSKITVVMLGYITFDSNGPKSYKWKRYSANTLVKKVVVGKEKGLFTKAVETKYLYVQWIILIYINKHSLISDIIGKIKLCFRLQKAFYYSTFVYPVKMEYGWNSVIFGLKMMLKSGQEKIFLKFHHAQSLFQKFFFTS